MDKRLLIGFFVFLGAFLVLPIALQQYRLSKMPVGAEMAVGGVGTPAAPPADPLASVPELNQLPLLNEMNLIGTEWQIQAENYKIKVTLASGGVCYATHPLSKAIAGVDYLEGRWRVENDKFYVFTSFGGKDYNTVCKISGNNIYYIEGTTYRKIERFR